MSRGLAALVLLIGTMATGQALEEEKVPICASQPHATAGGKRFDGKVIAISGASSGIGEVIAKKLAQDGAIVVLGARRVDKLAKIVDEIKAAGGEAQAERLDVTDYQSCVRFVQFINNTHGRLDAAFNNAGGSLPSGDFMQSSVEDFRSQFDLNFWGTYHMMKAELAVMTEQKFGSIVNNLSLFSSTIFTAAPAYSVAKSAAKSAQEVAAATVAGTQVRVNSVSPGFTLPSEALQEFFDKSPGTETLFHSPQGRIYDAINDIYPAVAYFFDDISKSVTGVDLPISGGHNLPVVQLR